MEATSSVRNVRSVSRIQPASAKKQPAGASVQRLMSTYLRPLEEARALPAAHFTEMPAVTVLELEVPGWSGPVWLRSDAAMATPGTDIVLGAEIWHWLVEAAEADRLYLADFRALLARIYGGEVLTREDVLGPVRAEPPRGWSVGQVLARLGARLFSVRVEESLTTEAQRSANTAAFQDVG